MNELVNTSLPNGLIAGTHGFATVAMTKGMPDSLRSRVEAYCAYAHRTNAHDASYNLENPVNWFHAVLPQGDHVVGRTAPAEFDYTGRTNRLARTFVFGKNAMPLVGGARVLLLERARLSEPWQGEARWLDEDLETEARLRREQIGGTTDAPAWRRMFGDADGLDFARKFARLLAKNVRQGGKAISFKTSAARDADGMELLALFADLIDLLPFSLRSDVAFSTYSASWPNGSVCHLRGVYDRDRAFDMAATTQPWVDCENRTVHNAAALPTEDTTPTKDMAAPRTESGSRTEDRPRTMQTATPSVQSQRTEQAARYLPERKDGTKTLVIGLTVICSLITVAIIGAGVWFWRDSVRKNEVLRVQLEQIRRQDEERQRTEEENARKIREDAARRDREEQERKRLAEEEAAARKDAEKKAEDEKKRKADALAQKAHPKQSTSHPEETWRFAFTNATELVVGNPNERLKEKDKESLTNGTLRVYWYDESRGLTNCSAGFDKRNAMGMNEFKLRPERETFQSSPCILWYDGTKKTLYWEWNLPHKPTNLTSDGKVDLQEHCFGCETDVYATWKHHQGEIVRYSIAEHEAENGKGDKRHGKTSDNHVVSVTNRILTLAVLKDCLEAKSPKANSKDEHGQKEVDDCYTKQKAFDENLEKYQGLTNDYANTTNACAKYSLELKNAKKDADKTKWRRERNVCQKEKDRLEKEIRDHVREKMGLDSRSSSGSISSHDFKDWGEQIAKKITELKWAVTKAEEKVIGLQQKAQENAHRPMCFIIKKVECSRQGDDGRKGASE